MLGGGEKVYGSSLYFLLNYSVNLKLLLKSLLIRQKKRRRAGKKEGGRGDKRKPLFTQGLLHCGLLADGSFLPLSLPTLLGRA